MSTKPLPAGMFRFTLAQMRLSLPRLVAGGLAVAIGAAFVAATLLAGDVMTRTARNSVSASFAQADLVISDPLSDRQLGALAAVPGVAVVAGRQNSSGQLTGPGGSDFVPLGSVLPDPRLEPQRLSAGQLPGPGQIALPAGAAARLGVGVGGAVTQELSRPVENKDGTPSNRDQTKRYTLTVSGITRDPSGAFSTTGGLGLVTAATIRDWQDYQRTPHSAGLTLVLLRPGAGASTVQASMDRALAHLGSAAGPDDPLPQVRTVTQQADEAVAQLTGDTRILLVVVLSFAALSMLVAALVIANTFQVLVAQRTQTLALLRCVGALKQQLRRSVLIEALIVGIGASAVGVLGGSALAQVTLLVLRRLEVAEQLPSAIRPGGQVIVWPIVLGTVVTVIASLAPARAATRVAPLAALRPDAGPRLYERAGRLRLVLSAGLVLLGALLLAAGVATTLLGVQVAGLAVGVLGGGLSFVGILLGTVFWVPRVAGLFARVLAAGGAPSAKLAAANSVRNPRRTAATTGALLIGVTLVALMTTGAASARASLATDLDSANPVDIAVGYGAGYGRPDPLSPQQLAALRTVPGVTAVESVSTASLDLRLRSSAKPSITGLDASGIDPAVAGRVLRSADIAEALRQGKVVAAGTGITGSGQAPPTVQLRAPGGRWITVKVAYALNTSRIEVFMPQALLTSIAPQASTTQAWLGVQRRGDAQGISTDVSDALADVSGGQAPPVVSAVVRRESYDRAIDGVLAVVVGLLGVSVVIALVGVANTLSLSVLERRRESATLRTIGLTRAQLRWTLAVEGMVIAAVGALSGIVLGVVYGWVGTCTVLGGGARGYATLHLELPLRQLGLTLLIALLAGLLASVLPSRSAARTSPVAALATT